MKLRHRFALTFAAASLGTLIVTRLVTIESFKRLQEYELDQGLRARAVEEGNEVALLGRKTLELSRAEQEEASDEEADPLEQLVTYGALYRADGSLVADTPSFAHAPALGELGLRSAMRSPGTCFDFSFRGRRLRGVLVDVRARQPTEPAYLLLAVSRRELDDDARGLLKVGWWVVVACMPFALALGWLLGRRMTRGVESLATAAGRVTAGELDMDLAPEVARDEEVAALGSSLREMVARLKGLIETERRFASHAAHELRSPLAALRGELELALRRERSKPEYEATLRGALEDTNRLVELAEDLLVVARSKSGAVDDGHEVIALREIVDEAIAASSARGSDAVVVEVDDGAVEARVRGARVALVRMLRNLVDNAVAHGGASSRGAVRIRVSCASGSGPFASVVVEDEGPGVPPEDRERLFEPFHRGAAARQEAGAGLGLGIAREVARDHGGDVVMDSPAHPTRFVARLPTVG